MGLAAGGPAKPINAITAERNPLRDGFPLPGSDVLRRNRTGAVERL
ncbi:MAG: hypothetical protein AB7Q45_01210 [Planctomycetaceae bacterium]